MKNDRLPRMIATAMTHPSQRSLPISWSWLLLLALLARIPAVFFSRGYDFFDEQFQYVDPGWHLASGEPFLETHEWTAGRRSWIYPWIVSCGFRFARFLGIDAPDAQMIVLRGMLALLSLLAVAGIYELAKVAMRRRLRPGALAFAMILASCNGVLVYQSVHANAAAFSCVLVIFGLGMFCGGGRLRALAAGAAFGLAACCRPQDAVYGAVMFGAAVAQRRVLDGLMLTLGVATMFCVQGFVDLATWGNFLHSPIEYVRFQLAASSNWGRRSPWIYLGLVFALAPLLHIGVAWLMRGSRRLPWISIAMFASLLAHQLFERKASRFVTPALVLVVTLWAIGYATRPRIRDVWSRLSIGTALVLHVALFLVATFSYSNRHRIETARYLATRDVRGVVYYDLSAVDTGGAFYARSSAPRFPVKPPGVAVLLDSLETRPDYLVARSDERVELPEHWTIDALASFSSVWDPKDKRRYTVYALRYDP